MNQARFVGNSETWRLTGEMGETMMPVLAWRCVCGRDFDQPGAGATYTRSVSYVERLLETTHVSLDDITSESKGRAFFNPPPYARKKSCAECPLLDRRPHMAWGRGVFAFLSFALLPREVREKKWGCVYGL